MKQIQSAVGTAISPFRMKNATLMCSVTIPVRQHSQIQEDSGLNTGESALLAAGLNLQRGRVCQDCGGIEWRGRPIPLENHHLDGDSENNSRENMRLICPNYHAQTPNYKSRNYGRSTRVDRRVKRHRV